MALSGGLRLAVTRWLGVGFGLLAVGLVAEAMTAQQVVVHLNALAAERAHSIAQSVSESRPPTGPDAWLVEPDWCPPLPGSASGPDAPVSDQCEAPGRSMPAAPLRFDAPITTLAAVTLDNRVPHCQELSVGADFVLCAWPAASKTDQAVVVSSPLATAAQRGQAAGIIAVVISGVALLAARALSRPRLT